MAVGKKENNSARLLELQMAAQQREGGRGRTDKKEESWRVKVRNWFSAPAEGRKKTGAGGDHTHGRESCRREKSLRGVGSVRKR